jgi:formylglycine-generating enzyme required for sulfatase activity
MKKNTLILTVLAVIFVFASCKDNDEDLQPNTNPPTGEFVLNEKTHIVNDTESNDIIAVDNDKVIFGQSSMPSDIEVGSIIASGITDKSPAGYLRRVVSIEDANEQTVLRTEQATLTDAIKKGSVSGTIPITVDDILEVELSDGTIFTQQQLKAAKLRSASATNESVPIFTFTDEEEVRVNEYVTIKGAWEFTMSIRFDCNIDNNELQYLKTGLAMQNKSGLTIKIAATTTSLPEKLKNGITIFKVRLAPCAFLVGPVPVVFTHSIDLVAGLDATAKIQIQTSFEAENTMDALIVYNKGEGFKPEFPSTNTCRYTPFDMTLEGSMEPFLGAYYKCNLYSVADANLEIGPRASFPVEGSWNALEARLKMDFLLQLHTLANAGILGAPIAHYDKNWEVYRKNIFDNKTTFGGNDDGTIDYGIEMVSVQGGTTTLNGQTVKLNTFKIGKYEITQKQWESIMKTIPAYSANPWLGYSPSTAYGVGDNYPAYFVSWEDAQIFISQLNNLTGKNYRLPTEAEWEYAAKGGQQTHNYSYSGSNALGLVAWNGGNSNGQTHPVGSLVANELGIYDMSGNVWEWCNDWWDKNNYPSEEYNPTGTATGSSRVMRGGSWNCGAPYAYQTSTDQCLVSYRCGFAPNNRYLAELGNSYRDGVGLRVVLP